jgi:drug/metabolite transporter superfamily protein YnfA
MPDVDQSKRAFEDSVKAILTTFGVFTGFVIKGAIEGINFKPSSSWLDSRDEFLGLLTNPHLYICLATVALLLRFILGSAVHLNLCYVVEPRSKMPIMLFKDLAFLIVFGVIAVFMIDAKNDVLAFAARAGVFVLVGLLWSVIDRAVRRGQTSPGEKSLFSREWILIDLCQLVAILIVLFVVSNDLLGAFILAVGFSIALYRDMTVVLAARKSADPDAPPTPAVAAAAQVIQQEMAARNEPGGTAQTTP